MPNGFREVKSSRCEAAVLPGSYSLRHRRQKGEKVKCSHAPFAFTLPHPPVNERRRKYKASQNRYCTKPLGGNPN
jgi:hypothetical protein